MDRRAWKILSAIVVGGVLAPSTLASARDHDADKKTVPTITVRVDDKAGVQGALLEFAKARASEVFAMSGVRVEWVDGDEANRLKITASYNILIMAEAPAKLKAAMDRIGTDVMGQAAPSVGRAYIYYDRVVAFRPIPPRDIVSTLGDVMAHELGHLILPPGHSSVGIMRPTIEMRSRRVETFTDIETGEIEKRLRNQERTSATQ